jgi:hypothetical protein
MNMSFSYTSKLLLYCTMNELCYISNHQNFWSQSLIDFASYLYEEFCAASYTTRNIWSKSLIQFGSYILPRIVCSVIYYQKKMVFNGMRSCVRCVVKISEDEASLVCLRCREKEDGNRSSKAMNRCEGCNLFFAPISGEKACQGCSPDSTSTISARIAAGKARNLQKAENDDDSGSNVGGHISDANSVCLSPDGLLESLADTESEVRSFGTAALDPESCWNCHREYRGNIGFDDGNLEYLKIVICYVESKSIGFTRKLCHITKSDAAQSDMVPICKECCAVVVKGSEKVSKASLSKVAWPSYIWSILKSPSLRSKFGVTLWQFIPFLWRESWLVAVHNFPEFQHVTLNSPVPYFREVTTDHCRLVESVKNLRWVEMVKAVDELGAIPTVKCPWGCSEFVDKGNDLPLDVVFERFLNQPDRKRGFSDQATSKCMNGCRDDFLKPYFILHNPQWECSPSIRFVHGRGPCVATCSHHSSSSRGMYFHIPTSPTGTIMTSGSDQFSPAIAVPKTVHGARPKKYTNRFQMNRMEGHYQGIDTLTITDRGRFNINDNISDERDSLSMAARPELREHLSRLAEQGSIPGWLSEQKLNGARDDFPPAKLDTTRQEHCRGATFMSLEDAMELEHLTKWKRTLVVRVPDPVIGSRDQHYEGCWPLCIVWLHPGVGNHGASPPILPPTAKGRT